MYKMMMACIAVLAMPAPAAMAEEPDTDLAYRSAAQAQKTFVMSGTDAFEQTSGSDVFDPSCSSLIPVT